MRSVETTGADIEEAIEKGLKLLDVARENVIVEIIEEPNRGLLGLGSKEATVRLTTVVPPRSEREKYISSSTEESQSKAESSQPSEDLSRPSGGYVRHEAQGERGGSERRERHEGSQRGGNRDRGERPSNRGNQYRGNRNERGVSRGRGNNQSGRSSSREYQKQQQQELESIEPRRATLVVENETAIPDGVKVGAETLAELLQNMGIKAEISIERIQPEEEGAEVQIPWLLHIHGDDLGVLIGRRGETLSALQYLTRLIASRDIQSRAEFAVDVEDYKARREIQLERLAERKAREAVRRGRTVYLDPMTPNERRIIHMVLRENPDVETESTGDEPMRRVTIVPKHQ